MLQEAKNNMVSKLHEILKPFLLRRIKSDVEASLPAKQEIVLYAPLTDLQKEIQSKVMQKTLISEVSDMAKQNGSRMPLHGSCPYFLVSDSLLISVCGAVAGVDIAKLNNILMQLRKNCNHPDLLTCEWEETVTFPTPDVLVQQCGKMQVLDRLLTSLRAGGHKVLIFSQVRSSTASSVHCSVKRPTVACV